MNNTQNTRPVQLKSAIIGKAWVNSKGVRQMLPNRYTLTEEMVLRANESYLIGNLTFRTDRNLTEEITLKAGENLMFFSNPKRPDKQDPDYSVSVMFPVDLANKIIEGSRKAALEWKQANQA